MRAIAFSALVTLALAAAGCGDSEPDSTKTDTKVQSASFALTDAGCDPAELEIESGPITIQVVNNGSASVTELEIVQGDRILGEIENLSDGLSGDFTLSLQPGSYELYCPNGTTAERGTLTVVGDPIETGPHAAATKAVNDYRAYVVSQAGLLQRQATVFTNAVRQGKIETAKQLFPTAREPYERIEPVAESFGSLDPEIDARAGDVPAATWTGFHRLEKMLWADNATPASMKPIADKLDKDIDRLAGLVAAAEYEPAQIANGAKSLMDEIGASKVTGEEDRYSHTDLYDFQANVDGAQAVYGALGPLLRKRSPGLSQTIEKQFTKVAAALEPHREGFGWVTYTEVTAPERRKLALAVDALAEPLSKMSAVVAQ